MQLGQPGPGGMAYALPSQAEEEHSELFSTDDFRIWCMKVSVGGTPAHRSPTSSTRHVPSGLTCQSRPALHVHP